ncbi:unnamed protein product [Ostreobium quekettii]|uniref:ABC transporter domain-containing protein n=1 Tax=Ostreobium quekettii TaxID=121088 RepID=A0A8S1J4I1_9CHLO|nr:unnamed protein product [Ostreobium quekettii]|eukprot:evm.model.scf_232EXC.3 EVM.evm.TU.scf_232EXC.3   scf_232EXC:37095-49151(-)
MAGTTFLLQTNALLRKNAIYQKRHSCVNVATVLLPLVFVLLLTGLQSWVDDLAHSPENQCGCMCTLCCTKVGGACRNATSSSQCSKEEECRAFDEDVCGLQYSTTLQAIFCEQPHPSSWPPVVQIPVESKRAMPWRPNAVMMYAGNGNGTLAREIVKQMLPPFVPRLPSGKFLQMGKEQDAFRGESFVDSGVFVGSSSRTSYTHFIEPAFLEPEIYGLTQDCTLFPKAGTSDAVFIANDVGMELPLPIGPGGHIDLECVKSAFSLSTVESINKRLFCSFEKAHCNLSEKAGSFHGGLQSLPETVQEYSNAWDFKGSDLHGLDVDIWYPGQIEGGSGNGGPFIESRVNLAQNLAADSWLKWALGGGLSTRLLAVEEMPKPATTVNLQFSSIIAELLFCWVIQLLMPLMLGQLVYEKEHRLRMMMKMHGLGDAAYWVVNYMYYLVLYMLYIAVFIGVGSLAGLAICSLTDYGVQFVFYFLFGNVQILFAFLLSSLFDNSQTAMAFGLLWVFMTGLIADSLLKLQIQRELWYVNLIELIPSFGAYRGLYEMAEYSFRAANRHSTGLGWNDLKDPLNGMSFVLLSFLMEWPILLLVAWQLERCHSAGAGSWYHYLWSLCSWTKGRKSGKQQMSWEVKEGDGDELAGAPLLGPSDVRVDIDASSQDVDEERARVAGIPLKGDSEHSIVVRSLRKVFPGIQGGPEKVAVNNLDLAIRRGEVFGLLGPNGSGKTTFLNMLSGFLQPTEGTALVAGLGLDTDMDQLHRIMGVCPQHNVLWDTVTGREHLLFYGRLKGLAGAELQDAADSALKSVRLFNYGFGDMMVREYSGGMKRRLSVAISLIGSPKIVYLDEPSTGLDPASRRSLWEVVKKAKVGKSTILTTHSMEEAEVLCDRLGIIVDGQLMVIGHPKELAARYGGYLVFTLVTNADDVGAAKALVQGFDPTAQLTYELAGTLTFELSTKSVNPSDVFRLVEKARDQIQVLDWGLANATLEDVFLKIARSAGARTDHLH